MLPGPAQTLQRIMGSGTVRLMAVAGLSLAAVWGLKASSGSNDDTFALQQILEVGMLSSMCFPDSCGKCATSGDHRSCWYQVDIVSATWQPRKFVSLNLRGHVDSRVSSLWSMCSELVVYSTDSCSSWNYATNRGRCASGESLWGPFD
jgi:hypothetical protein